MKKHPPLTADDLTWLPDVDDDDGPNGPPEVEQPPSSAKDAEETSIKRKANAKIRQIESVTSTRDDKSLSEIELAEDWLETQGSDRYLYADGLGWRRYLHGRWHDGGHEIYKDISAFIRARVEATASARTLTSTPSCAAQWRMSRSIARFRLIALTLILLLWHSPMERSSTCEPGRGDPPNEKTAYAKPSPLHRLRSSQRYGRISCLKH